MTKTIALGPEQLDEVQKMEASVRPLFENLAMATVGRLRAEGAERAAANAVAEAQARMRSLIESFAMLGGADVRGADVKFNRETGIVTVSPRSETPSA